MRKSLIALASGAFLLLGALPAFAQGGISASLSGVASGQAVQGPVTLVGSASASTGVESITISVNNGQLKKQTYGGIQQNPSTSVGWNTTGYNNGDYTVKVTAVSNGGGSAFDSARVLVDNAPSTPSGLYTTHSDGVVTFGWNTNPESDVYAYRVSRDGNFLIETSGTSITDRPGPGDHLYTVTAVRHSPTSSSGRTGGTASTSLNVPTPPPASSGDTGGSTPDGYGDSGGSTGGYGNTGSGGNGSKGGKNTGFGYNGGKDGPGGTPSGYGSFYTGGRSLPGIGLPGNLTLPGGRLTGYAPSEAPATGDDTFQEALPYDLSDGATGAELLGEGGPNVAARRTSFLIPPDGLRWVAAGLWFIVTAALLKFLERIVAKREESEAAAAAAEVTEDAGKDPSDDPKSVTPKIRFRKDTAA